MQFLKKLCHSGLWTHRDLHDNNFTGVIPNLARLGNLATLTLNGNAFSGSIEHVFHGLNTTLLHGPNTTILYWGLIWMDLSSNQLTGCIPGLTTGLGDWSRVSAIQYLNLSHNNIGGQFNISDQFSQGSLTTLDSCYNISRDIIRLAYCEQAISCINGPFCELIFL
jgi:hypothetical protein